MRRRAGGAGDPDCRHSAYAKTRVDGVSARATAIASTMEVNAMTSRAVGSLPGGRDRGGYPPGPTSPVGTPVVSGDAGGVRGIRSRFARPAGS
jgi:hypothetical protein